MHNLCATRETGTLMDKETITNDTSANEAEVMDAVPETNVVDELTRKYDELNDKYLRLAAEYENFRKRCAWLNEQKFEYLTEEDRLFIESRYGDSARIIHDIALGAICAIGTEQEIFEQYGNGQSYEKVYTRGCPLPLRAIAYRKENKRLKMNEVKNSNGEPKLDKDGNELAKGEAALEPFVDASVITPQDFVGAIMDAMD